MSSPIANSAPTAVQKQLRSLHHHAVHSNRIAKLSACIGEVMGGLFPAGMSPLRALDVGCGDMTIAEIIAAKYPAIAWTCTDVYDLPAHLHGSEKWKKYQRFDGISLPFPDATFEVVLFSDVLHHCLPNATALLREAGRVARYVVVKDHFERGQYSRQALRLMDFIGNYGYGVKIPQKYFTRETFRTTYAEANLVACCMQDGMDLYSTFPLGRFLLREDWQFLAVLENSSHGRRA